MSTLRTSLKKTFYYTAIPTKEEEEAAAARRANNAPWQAIRSLVEIRDLHPPPVLDYQNPIWHIRKTINQEEFASGKFVVAFADALEHVLRYWTMSMANDLVLGVTMAVVLWDVTDENNPMRYRGDGIYFQIFPNDDFHLGCLELFADRRLNVDDRIGLIWDPWTSAFHFKLLRRGVPR